MASRSMYGKNQDTRVLGTSSYAVSEQYGIFVPENTADIFVLRMFQNVVVNGNHSTKNVLRLAGHIVRKCIQIAPEKELS